MATLGPAQKTNVDLGTRKRKALSDIGNDNNGDYPDGDSALLDKRSPAVSKRKKTQRVITKDSPQTIEIKKRAGRERYALHQTVLVGQGAGANAPSTVEGGAACTAAAASLQ